MCTEFFLAFIYFVAIIIVNYFLYQLIINYLKNISYLWKISKIFKEYPENETYALFYKFLKKENKKSFLLKKLSEMKNKDDILIIGNIYKYLDDNIDKSSEVNKFNTYYFSLLKYQYLSINFNLK